jgi:hypothetical protein
MRAAGARSLADVMAGGPLPLSEAVAYAGAIAADAAVFHRGGRAHGALAPAWIKVGRNGPELPQPSGTSRLATRASDLRDFGLLFHQMLTGRDPGEVPVPASADDSLESSPETVRAAALRLAERCRRAPGQSDMRRVSAELRLLRIVLNSFGPGERVGWAAGENPAQDPTQDPGAIEGPATSEKPRTRMCPSCGSSQLFEAQHLTLLETLLAVVDLKTYRCYGCFRRFLSVFGLLLPRPETD